MGWGVGSDEEGDGLVSIPSPSLRTENLFFVATGVARAAICLVWLEVFRGDFDFTAFGRLVSEALVSTRTVSAYDFLCTVAGKDGKTAFLAWKKVPPYWALYLRTACSSFHRGQSLEVAE